MAQLRAHGQTEYLQARLIPQYSAYLSFTGGPALRELEHASARRAPCRSIARSILTCTSPRAVATEFRCDLSYLGTYAADRQPKLMSLA